MAKKSRERVLFEVEIKGLREVAEGHEAEAGVSMGLAQAATQKADLIQSLLNQAEEELKKAKTEEPEEAEEEAEEDPF